MSAISIFAQFDSTLRTVIALGPNREIRHRFSPAPHRGTGDHGGGEGLEANYGEKEGGMDFWKFSKEREYLHSFSSLLVFK